MKGCAEHCVLTEKFELNCLLKCRKKEGIIYDIMNVSNQIYIINYYRPSFTHNNILTNYFVILHLPQISMTIMTNDTHVIET